MSTLAQMNAKMAEITTGGLNTALEALDCWNILKDEFFTDVIKDTKTTTNVITKISTSITYNVTFKKQGNRVDVILELLNSGSTPITTVTELMQITNSLFAPKNLSVFNVYYLHGYLAASSANTFAFARIDMATGKIYSSQNVPAGGFLVLSGFYYVNS